MAKENTTNSYWKTNILYLIVLMILWFIISFGCGILFSEKLDAFRLGGFKLGFWFAQQGSIYGFIIIIFAYIWLMNRLDKKHNVKD